MASFDRAVEFTLTQEGVFSNDPGDRGGKTKYGITKAELVVYQSRAHRLRGRAIEDLTRDEAIEIYRADYWRFDGIASQMIATKLFDLGVNMGVGAATRIAQQAANFRHDGNPLAEDGAWGARTEAVINATSLRSANDRLMLFKAIVLFAAKRYVDITLANPSQITFLDGWISRCGRRPPD